MQYQDQWTRWHHKKTEGVNPSSHNGWIYTAYAKYLAPETYDRLLKAEKENTMRRAKSNFM